MRISQIILAGLVLIGCAPSETNNNTIQVNDNTDPAPFTMLATPRNSNDCSNGGTSIDVGFDDNGNGELDPDEVRQTHTVCNGENGTDAIAQIVEVAKIDTEVENRCTIYGGLRLFVGIDSNLDGSLENETITQKAYFCNDFNTLMQTRTCNVTATISNGNASENKQYGIVYQLDEYRNGEIEVSGEIITAGIGISKTSHWSPYFSGQLASGWSTGSLRVNLDVLGTPNNGYWMLKFDRNSDAGKGRLTTATDAFTTFEYVDAELIEPISVVIPSISLSDTEYCTTESISY